MIKQIFGKLPRKPSKSSHNDSNPNGEGGVNSYYIPNSGSSISKPSSKSSASNSNGANGTVAPSSNRTNQVNGVYEALPSFRDVPSLEKPNLFIKKLSMCCVVLDFSDPSKNLREKEIKRQTLLELVDYIAMVSTKLSDAAIQEIAKVAVVNLFRTFPSANHES